MLLMLLNFPFSKAVDSISQIGVPFLELVLESNYVSVHVNVVKSLCRPDISIVISQVQLVSFLGMRNLKSELSVNCSKPAEKGELEP